MEHLAHCLLEKSFVRDQISDTLDQLDERHGRGRDENIMMDFAEKVIEIWENRIDRGDRHEANCD